ncbi:hypothetical protein PL11201_240001 [Planktothrix sp. PCC 11201]|nr:hypothetical protein PL11201_240001 [Planktothrix sp. PCC 11201]
MLGVRNSDRGKTIQQLILKSEYLREINIIEGFRTVIYFQLIE